MKKRILSLVLVLCMVLSLLPTSALAAMTAQATAAQASANPFQDVKETDWYYDAVQYARVNGFFSGTSAAAFDPSGTMTRGMFVTVLGRMAGVDTAAYAGQSAFTDVPAGQYYAPYVAWAAKHGITGGTGEGKFSPDALIDRQQMATFFVRYLEKFSVSCETGAGITTVPADMDSVAGYAKEAVAKLWEKGLLNGDGRSFDPTGSATRAQTAALCIRLDKAVKVWYSEPGVPSTRVSIDPTAPKDDSGWGNDDWDSDSDSDPDTYAVRFYDGSRLIDTLYAEVDQPLSRTPSVEKYSKANAILVGWYTDPGCTTPFYAEAPVTANTAVYAKYEDMGDTETLNLTSYAQMDQSPDLSFTIKRTSGSVDAAEAAELTVKDGSDPVAISVTAAGDGTYTVAADEGFNEGCSYELTLADGWVFVDSETGAEKPDTIRTASFSIYMEEVENLKMNDGIRYIQDTAAIDYTVDGTSYAELTSDLADQGGTFRYDGEMPAVGDLLCIYVGVHPERRDAHNGSELLDPAVYVKVSDVSGDTVTFTKLAEEDQQEIYNIPDNFPIQVAQLPAEATGTVNISALDAGMYATMMGAEYDLDKAKESIAPGDFVTLYVAQDAITGETDLYYGEITAYDVSTGEITYTQTTRQTILESMDLYANVGLEGSDLITDEEKAELEAVLLEQVRSSGFAEDAAYMLADIVTKTDGFRSNMTIQELLLTDENGDPLSEDAIQLMNIGGTFELSDDIELTVELINEGDQLHFEHGSVQMAVGVDATFEVDVDDDKIAIDLSATFVQEVGLDPRIKGKMVYKEILWIPVPIGVNVSASIDIRSFSAISLDAKVYTVAEEEKGTWDTLKDIAKKPADALGLDSLPDGLVKGLESVGDVMDKIDELKEKAEKAKEAGEKFQGYLEDADTLWAVVEENGIVTEEAWEAMGEALGKTSITSDLLDLMNLSTETELSTEYYESMQELMNRYCKMIEQESDWIKLVDAQIMMVEINILGVVMGVEARFIVRTDMSLAIGSNLQYEVGKRFNFWFEVGLFEPTGGSDSMDLIDEQFAFQFYAMGRIALKAGVRARCYTGIGSKAFASAGYAVELGPYVKAYGFFVYEYTKHRAANTDDWIASDRMAGAVFMEFGLYFRIGYEANLIGSLIDIKVDFCDVMIPLFNVGESQYCYMFDYQPAEDEMVLVQDGDGNSTNGIAMALPDSMKTLRYVGLDNGRMGYLVADADRYIATVSNPNFGYDPQTGLVAVSVPEGTRYMECDLTLTYKYGKMAFSTYDMSVTVPLVWTNLSTEELSQYYTASVRVGNAKDGYETVWSKRVLKNQEFDLPTDDEIREMIGWSDYKYTGSSGYGSQTTTGLTLIEDTAYDYKVNYKTYKLTVEDIQNADGATYSKTYTAKFGEAFDLSGLDATGTSDPSEQVYTRFHELTTDATITVGGEKVPLDLTQKINAKMADALSSGVTAAATYVDNSAAVTFEFTGLAHDPVTMTVCRGTVPSLEEVEEIVSYNGLALKDIFPAVGKVYADTVYQVVCGELTGPDATITFHENGGSEVEDITKVVGSLVGTLPTPTREGYTFDGWYTDDGTFDDEFTARKMPEGGAELYAKWTAEEYTLTFHVNGGNSLDDSTKTITFGETYGQLPEPTRSGHGFVGWFTEAEGGEAVTAADIVTTAGDHTLYAHWKVLKEIPAAVFDFGEAEGGTYEKGLTHEVLYAFAPEDGETYAEDDFTFKYMRQGSSEYESGLPVNAGTYNVTVSRPADNDYAKFEQTYTAVITIDKAIRSEEAFANVDIWQQNCGLNYIEVQLAPGSIDDFSSEDTKVIFTAAKVDGNFVIPSEGASSQMAPANETVRITNLLPDTVYGVTFQLVDDPNYCDYTYTGYVPTGCTTLPHSTSTLWTDYAEEFVIDEESKTVTIENEAQLAYLAKTVNEGTHYAGYTFTLARDLWMLDHAWTPIGTRNKMFSGVFDGDGHTIYELHTSGSAEAGLFGATTCRRSVDSVYYYPVIQNLTLAESYVSGTQNTGAIVGYANAGTLVLNCVNESTVVGLNAADQVNGTGGIAGYVYGGTITKIERCVNNGRVDGICQTGGIAGKINTGLVVNNINNGPVKGTNNHTGGILGYVESGNVMNNANFGSVTGTSCVGGIAGQVEEDGWVLNCYTTGTIKGTVYYVGAAIGRNVSDKGVTRGLYYLKDSATCNGSYRNASGTKNGSMDDGDTKHNLSAASFTSPTSILSRDADCGNSNLINALNTWVEWWNDYQCNAEWEEGPDGYPLPTGPINTEKGTQR